MYSYRFKVPTFFLGMLLLVMLINVVGNSGLRRKIARVPLEPLNVQSDETFAAKIATLTDPVELRQAAVKEHQRVAAASRSLDTMGMLLGSLSRSLLLQTWGLLALALCYYLFEYRTPR